MNRTLPFALAGALALTPSSAIAALRVGVLPFAPLAGDVPQGAGDKGAEILRKQLKTQGDFEVVAAGNASHVEGPSSVIEARSKVAEAKAAVAKHQGSIAVADYRAALAAFAKGVRSLDSFEEFVEAEAQLGVLLYRLGREDEGQKVILDALRLSPGQPIRALSNAPSFAPTLEGLEKQVAHLGKGSIRVDSTPSGADVYVDGQAAGKSPVVLRDLPAGKHYVRALLPSGERWGEVMDVVAKAEPHLRAQTGGGGPGGDVDGQLAENGLQPSVMSALKKAAASNQLGLLVFGALHRTINGLALDAFVFNADKGAVSRLKRVAFDTEMLEAGLQMDKIVAEVHKSLGGAAPVLSLPSKVAPDLAAERELATEYHYGGTPDAPIEQSPPPANAADDQANSNSRVIRKAPEETE